MFFFRNPLALLLLSVVEVSSNNVIISPGGDVKGARAVISFAEHQTTQDRHAYLQVAQERGYTCWLFPDYHTAAVCIQVPPKRCLRFQDKREREKSEHLSHIINPNPVHNREPRSNICM